VKGEGKGGERERGGEGRTPPLQISGYATGSNSR